MLGGNSDLEEDSAGIGVGPAVPGGAEGIWDALAGEWGIDALLGSVGSSQAKELLWGEEEEELRLLGLAELPPVAVVALVTSGSAGLSWPCLWNV